MRKHKILSKAYAKLGLMHKVKYIHSLDRNSLQKLYFSFIRPVLEYADIIWDNIPEYLSLKIENIQLEAARIVTGGNRLASKTLLYKETGWVPLSKRREDHRLILLFKMFHGKVPNYLLNLLQTQLLSNESHNTRSTNSIREIYARTKLYYDSFLPNTIRLWNTIPSNVQNNPSIRSFKKYLNKNKITVPEYYHIGSRIGQILHSQLRLECSTVNLYMFNNNLCPSPFCSCGSVENTDHYLLHCPKYATIRNITINTLANSTDPNLLLYGSNYLSIVENEQIFHTVQRFILESKRFGNHNIT